MTARQIRVRLDRGSLRRLHRGVYTVGAATLRHESRLFAALLGGPPDAVVSHGSAAPLWGMLPPSGGPVHLTTASGWHDSDGLVVHRSTSHAATATQRSGIPCTSMPRTLVDVAGWSGPIAAERAWSTLGSRRALRPRSIERELRRHRGRSGVPIVRALLERHRLTVTGHTRSRLEAAALEMCAAQDLAPPRVNSLVRVDDTVYEADLLWDEPRVIVELDDWTTHGHADGFRADRGRDLDTGLAGWQTVRLLWEDVTTDSERTARRLERLFAGRLRERGAR